MAEADSGRGRVVPRFIESNRQSRPSENTFTSFREAGQSFGAQLERQVEFNSRHFDHFLFLFAPTLATIS
jgi:hypothetical protein